MGSVHRKSWEGGDAPCACMSKKDGRGREDETLVEPSASSLLSRLFPSGLTWRELKLKEKHPASQKEQPELRTWNFFPFLLGHFIFGSTDPLNPDPIRIRIRNTGERDSKLGELKTQKFTKKNNIILTKFLWTYRTKKRNEKTIGTGIRADRKCQIRIKARTVSRSGRRQRDAGDRGGSSPF